MGIFGKKPGLDLDDEESLLDPSSSPRRDAFEQLPPRTMAPQFPPQSTLAPSAPSVMVTSASAPTTPTPNMLMNSVAKDTADVNKVLPYTIEDVIRLMRDLPDSKKEMVVIIVQKTLLSAKIDIASILDDASRKVEKLQKQNEKLVAEIRELEEAIIVKKGEVDTLTRDIEETNGVKTVFENVYGRHVRSESEIAADKAAQAAQSMANQQPQQTMAPQQQAQPQPQPQQTVAPQLTSFSQSQGTQTNGLGSQPNQSPGQAQPGVTAPPVPGVKIF